MRIKDWKESVFHNYTTFFFLVANLSPAEIKVYTGTMVTLHCNCNEKSVDVKWTLNESLNVLQFTEFESVVKIINEKNYAEISFTALEFLDRAEIRCICYKGFGYNLTSNPAIIKVQGMVKFNVLH